MNTLTTPIKKSRQHHQQIKEKIDSIELEAHWFRRIFHTFAASFLIYYILPDEPFINSLKISLIIGIVVIVFLLEVLRLKEILHSMSFFGLRRYEEKRPASYLYFGIATLLLLLFFPQQIAIPCILCACFSDPIMGELRQHYSKKETYVIGFFISLFFFIVAWHTKELWITIPISLIGASAAVLGETTKIWYLDDDFMIQMLPATILLIIWRITAVFDLNILPAELLLPL